MWLLFIALLSGGAFCSELDSYDYDNNLDATNDQLTSNVYILPKQIFNDGKPFYVKKDPVSGTLNFNAKTTPAEPAVDNDAAIRTTSTTLTTNGRRGDEKRNGTNASDVKHDISVKTSTAQNIHDYLNLPVKYSSSKFVYPLVSSSYANLKYQGNNKNYISNHKYDSTTLKSVPVTANNYKKYKTPYPTKAHYYGSSSSSSTMPKKVSTSPTTTTTTTTVTMTNAFESMTKSPVSVHGTRPQLNDMPSAPRPSYTTIGHKDRVNNTITRNPTPSAMRPIVVPSENRLEKENATHSAGTPSKSASEKEQNGGDSMNFGDLFNYFFDSDDNEATEQNEEQASKGGSTTATAATTRVPSITTQRPHDRRTSIEVARNASATTTTKTATSAPSTPTPTKEATTSSITTTSTRIPTTQELRRNSVSPTPGHRNPDQFSDHLRPFNGHGTNSNFHPPASNEMSNIVVAPGSHTASFVATGQLSAGNNFDRRPIADASYRPAPPVNDIVTGSFAMKGQVSDVYAQHQQQQHVNFHVPSSNMNNIVVAPGSQTASFITTSQLAMGAPIRPDIADSDNGESQVNEQQIKNTMNAINVYDTIKLSTQRPQGFTMPTTTSTSRPSSTQGAQSSSEPNRVRFPAEQTEGPPPMLTLQQQQQQQLHQNNSVKFPSTPNSAAEPLPAGHVKLDTRNEIYDRNNYKQVAKLPFNVNRVVFDRPPAQPQPNLVEQPNAMASAQAPSFNPNMHSPPPFNFKKPPFIQYPRKNLTLPNILPQFRPNTQLPTMDGMNQLRPGYFNRPPPFVYGGQNVRYKPPMHYHHAGIRTKAPLLMPAGVHHVPIDQSHNRRHFELHQANVNQFNNRIFDRTLPQHILHRTIDRNVLVTHAPLQSIAGGAAAAAAAVVVDDQQYDESSAKVAVAANTATVAAVESNETPKVEPVTTLQQIQQQRLLHKQHQQPSIVDAVAAASENHHENHGATKTNNSQLYVVYPATPEAAAIAHNQHVAIPNKATATISAQSHNFPYGEKSQRYILNSRPTSEFDEKSDRVYERPEIAAENDDNIGDDR